MDQDPIDKLTNLPPAVRAMLKAKLAESHVEITYNEEKGASIFIPVDYVFLSERTSERRLDPDSKVDSLRKWQNKKGDTVYILEVEPSQEQLVELSERIKTEGANFKALRYSEQIKVRKDADERFRAYLVNEALREKFQKLK